MESPEPGHGHTPPPTVPRGLAGCRGGTPVPRDPAGCRGSCGHRLALGFGQGDRAKPRRVSEGNLIPARVSRGWGNAHSPPAPAGTSLPPQPAQGCPGRTWGPGGCRRWPAAILTAELGRQDRSLQQDEEQPHAGAGRWVPRHGRAPSSGARTPPGMGRCHERPFPHIRAKSAETGKDFGWRRSTGKQGRRVGAGIRR